MKCREAARALLAALDRHRSLSGNVTVRPEIVVMHKRGCKPFPCHCGATAQKNEINDALEALREAVK